MTVSNPAYVAFGVYVVYLAIVGVLWRVNDVHYEHLVDDRPTVVRGIVVPIGAGALFLAAAVTLLGWWQPVLVDDGRTGPAWALAVPILLALAGILGLGQIDWRAEGRRVLPVLSVGTLLVGFAEEVLTRGVLVVGGREQGWSALAVFLFSTILFGLLHGLNGFFGLTPKAALVQIAVASLGGVAFYVTRLSTGTLVVGILLHALWDFVTLGALATGRQAKPAVIAVGFASYLLGVIAIVVILVSG